MIGKGGLFFAAAAASFIGMIVTYKIVPRTKNKSLSELENLFTRQQSGPDHPDQVAVEAKLGESIADSGIVEDIYEMKTEKNLSVYKSEESERKI